MPIPQEVDDLQRQIKLLKDEIQTRQKRLVQLEKEIDTKRQQVDRCKLHKEMCHEHIQKIKKLEIVPLKDYREMIDLYEKNIDLVISNQIHLQKVLLEKVSILEQLPMLEAMLKDGQVQLSKWNVVVEFPKR